MSSKPAQVLFVAALVAAVVATAVRYQSRLALRELRMQVLVDELQPVAELLKEDQELLGALQTDPVIKDSGILASYLAEICADVLPKHADVKQQLD